MLRILTLSVQKPFGSYKLGELWLRKPKESFCLAFGRNDLGSALGIGFLIHPFFERRNEEA